MKKFEIRFFYTGNVCTASNISRTVSGDYEKIAFISEAGNIRWYVPVSSVPGDALLQIEHTASTHEANFKRRMDRERGFDPYGLLEKMLDRLSPAECRAALTGLEGVRARIDALTPVYLSRC